MNRILVVIFALLCIVNYSSGQVTKNIIYIFDSIPVTEHLEDADIDITPDFIDKVVIIRNKDSLKALGYENMGQAVFIYTKAFRYRASDVKNIPTTRQMKHIDERWYLKNSQTPYSGAFIDYYYSGLKQGEGTFKDGKLTGLRKIYYPNGNVEHEGYFENGQANGTEKDYYEDGSIKESGSYKNNKEDGVWQSFYPNGQLQLSSKYKKGRPIDAVIKYYSNGKIEEKVVIKRRKVIPDPKLVKVKKVYDKGSASAAARDYEAAINEFTKCIEMDGSFADAYIARASAKLNSFQFDDAIADFDKAIEIEPFFTEAIGSRALCKIRKYQFVNTRVLLQNSGASVLAEKDDIVVSAEEQQMVCDDLQKAIFLGDKSKRIKDAVLKFCTNKVANKFALN